MNGSVVKMPVLQKRGKLSINLKLSRNDVYNHVRIPALVLSFVRIMSNNPRKPIAHKIVFEHHYDVLVFLNGQKYF